MTTTSPTMRAIAQQRFGGRDELVLTTVPRPTPVPTEVLVRVTAAGTNPVDWKTREGGGATAALMSAPYVLGWDVAGVVEEVGFGVTTLKVGDRVFGMPWFPRPAGGYAEYVTAPARQLAKTPDAISDVEAAAVPLAALTAWQVLVDTAHVEKGDRVLITAGAGGVGHFAVQFAKHLGAHVIATASERNHAWLRELGADEVIDYHDPDHLALIKDIDLVVELAGVEQVRTATEVLRPGGLIVAVPSGLSGELAAAAAAGGFRATAYLVEPDGPSLATIGGLIADGAVTVEVAATFPLEQAAAAHELLESHRTRGKIVLEVAR
jgi:NADPH:quinone reductase-like Zn-dependent oxidoreductase